MSEKICVMCKNKPVWKGNVYKRNFWGLFCGSCQKKFDKNPEHIMTTTGLQPKTEFMHELWNNKHMEQYKK